MKELVNMLWQGIVGDVGDLVIAVGTIVAIAGWLLIIWQVAQR